MHFPTSYCRRLVHFLKIESNTAKALLMNAPKNTPFGTLNVNGMMVIAVNAGMAWVGSFQSTFSI